MRHDNLLLRAAGCLTAAVLAFALAACNPLENETDSQSQLIVESVAGLDVEGNESAFLDSDILFQDPDTGCSTIYADTAALSLTVRTLDPAPIMGVSSYADIQLTRYAVSYSRSDGRNTPGKDVPYAFEGGLTALIRVGQSTQVSVVIVRETAKQEPPLIDLLHAGTRSEGLYVTAKIELFGHDLGNKNVKATAFLPITFANFVNEGGGGGESAAGLPVTLAEVAAAGGGRIR